MEIVKYYKYDDIFFPITSEIADDEDSMQQNVPQWQFYFSSHMLRPVFLTLPPDVSLCLVKYFLLKRKNWQIIIDKNF